MPQSVREQIMGAIAAAKDEGQRVMLLILLAIADQVAEVREMTSETASRVSAMAGTLTRHDDAMRGIAPEQHIGDHALVGEIGSERRQASEDRRAIVRDARSAIVIKAAEWAAALALGMVGAKLLGV